MKHFGAALAFLSAVVGLIAASQQEGLERVVLIVVSLSLLYALVRLVWPTAVRLYNSVTRYEALARENAELRETGRDLREQVEDMRTQADRAFKAGIQEGKMQIIGSLRSSGVEAPPELVAISREAGALVLVAKLVGGRSLPAGARFRVVVRGTTSSKGVVEVLPEGGSGGTVTLVCVDPSVSEFWDDLARRVDADPKPPEGVILMPLELDLEDIAPRLGGTDLSGQGES